MVRFLEGCLMQRETHQRPGITVFHAKKIQDLKKIDATRDPIPLIRCARPFSISSEISLIPPFGRGDFRVEHEMNLTLLLRNASPSSVKMRSSVYPLRDSPRGRT